jgi:hypothetical protein
MQFHGKDYSNQFGGGIECFFRLIFRHGLALKFKEKAKIDQKHNLCNLREHVLITLNHV